MKSRVSSLVAVVLLVATALVLSSTSASAGIAWNGVQYKPAGVGQNGLNYQINGVGQNGFQYKPPASGCWTAESDRRDRSATRPTSLLIFASPFARALAFLF